MGQLADLSFGVCTIAFQIKNRMNNRQGDRSDLPFLFKSEKRIWMLSDLNEESDKPF
jgi:hypothetical protein